MPGSSEQHNLIWLAVNKDEWHEDLLSDYTFGFVVHRILNRKERQIVQNKIDEMADIDISKLYNITVETVAAYKSAILSKMKNNMEIHVERHLGKYLPKRRKK